MLSLGLPSNYAEFGVLHRPVESATHCRLSNFQTADTRRSAPDGPACGHRLLAELKKRLFLCDDLCENNPSLF